MTDLPEFYFRVRENGAAVFRLEAENRQRRLEMEQIAVLNIRNGEIRAQGDHVLTDAETTAINAWIEERRATLERREMEDILRAVDKMNLTTQWAQSRASNAQLEAVSGPLLMAMHDLRTVLVRKKANRLMKTADREPQEDTQTG